MSGEALSALSVFASRRCRSRRRCSRQGRRRGGSSHPTCTTTSESHHQLPHQSPYPPHQPAQPYQPYQPYQSYQPYQPYQPCQPYQPYQPSHPPLSDVRCQLRQHDLSEYRQLQQERAGLVSFLIKTPEQSERLKMVEGRLAQLGYKLEQDSTPPPPFP